MPSPVDYLLDAQADKQALIDEVTEEKQEEFRARYMELLWNVAERDHILWSRFIEDTQITVADFEEVEVDDRDPEWSIALAALWAASRQQAWLEVYGIDLIELAEKEGRKIETSVNGMTREQLKTAAVQGIGKKRFQDARDRRAALQQLASRPEQTGE